MTRKVLLCIPSRKRLVPASGTALSLVVFSSIRCGISARMPMVARAGTAVLAEGRDPHFGDSAFEARPH
jgi:hypothetical protein